MRVRPLRWRTLVITVAVSFGLSLAFTWSWLRGGATPVDVPWTTLPVALAASAVVLYLGWAIRQYKRGKRGPVDPQRAVRTVLLAQASAYAGALLSGVYGGYAFSLVPDWAHEPRREIAIAAGLCAVGGIAMLIAGAVAEWWCRIGPLDDDDAPEGPAAGVAH